jgi:hypothetical protein
MQEMAFPGFKFQKISGGACPRTPLALRLLEPPSSFQPGSAYVSELCFKHVYACVYIFCPCSCVRYPQLKSIYCGMVRLVVFRLPEYLCYLQHCIDGIFNLRLPPMYAIVIIPRPVNLKIKNREILLFSP